MKQYVIGITGHRPHRFRNPGYAKTICDDIVAIMKRHYGDALCFNLGGCIGADQWVGEACLTHGVKYNLFLPFPSEIQSAHWYDEQKNELDRQVANCQSMCIVGPEYKKENYFIRDRQIVDNADFVICVWEGAKYGGTFETVKYAVKQSKIVLNALTDFSLVTDEHLQKKSRYD